jgi:hypothetical protein
MPATDYKGLLYDRLWAILESDADVTSIFKPGNRVKLSGDGWLRQKIHRAPSDYPSLAIYPTRSKDSVYTQDPTLAEGDIDFTTHGGSWSEQVDYTFTLRIVTDRIRLNDIDPAEAAVVSAFRRAGPKLGLAWVMKWGPLSGLSQMANIPDLADPNGFYRLKTEIQLPVVTMFDGPDLL